MKTGFYFTMHLLLESLGNTTWLSEFTASNTLCFKLQLVWLVLETETFCSVPRCLTKFTYKSTKILIFLHLRTDLTTSYSHECVCVRARACVRVHTHTQASK